jgi:PKD repeat protein
MHETNRRQLLKTTAAGTGVALGAGGAGAVAAETAGPTDKTVERTFDGTPDDGFVVIDGDDAQGSGSLLGRIDYAGPNINTNAQINGEVYGDATWSSTDVTLPDLTDLILEIGPDTIITQIDIPNLLNTTEFDTVLTDLVNILDQLDPDQSQIDAIKTLVEGLLSGVNLGIPPSFILPAVESLLKDPKKQDIEDLLGLLVDLSTVTTVADLLDELRKNISSIPTPEGVEDLLLNLDFASLLASLSIDISVSGISGDFDPSSGLVTAPISDPTVTVSYNGTQAISKTLPLSVTLTSQQSGALTGRTSGLDTSSGTATLVDNEFTLGLGEIETLIKGIDFNSILLDVIQNGNFNISLPSGAPDLPTLIQNIDPNDLVGNLDLSQILGWYITDQPGRHYLQLVMDLTLEASGGVDLPPIAPGGDPPKDNDGDGLYEAVRGGNSASVLDVQTLFSNLNNPDIQNNSAKFNFSGLNENEVTIIDVQQLFNIVTGN